MSGAPLWKKERKKKCVRILLVPYNLLENKYHNSKEKIDKMITKGKLYSYFYFLEKEYVYINLNNHN